VLLTCGAYPGQPGTDGVPACHIAGTTSALLIMDSSSRSMQRRCCAQRRARLRLRSTPRPHLPRSATVLCTCAANAGEIKDVLLGISGLRCRPGQQQPNGIQQKDRRCRVLRMRRSIGTVAGMANGAHLHQPGRCADMASESQPGPGPHASLALLRMQRRLPGAAESWPSLCHRPPRLLGSQILMAALVHRDIACSSSRQSKCDEATGRANGRNKRTSQWASGTGIQQTCATWTVLSWSS